MGISPGGRMNPGREHRAEKSVEYLSPVTRTPMALEIDHRDLTNRINYDAVCLAHLDGFEH
jgi:hypothetical protein